MVLRCVLVLWILHVSALGQLLTHKSDITVRVGRSVYLRPDDLLFRPIRRGEECRVEVVQSDPITQRVGYLEPQIFNCIFLPETVRYVHDGSPLLSEDKVRLRVYHFTDTDTVSQTFSVNVKIVNASHEVIVTRGLRPVVVPEFNGLSNTIDGSVVRFHHSNSPNVSCTVGFSRYRSHWPLAGQMVMGERRRPVEAMRKECREFLFMKLHYEHIKSPTPDVDYLPLAVELVDPELSDEVITERFYLPIYIKGALPNSPPRSSWMSMYMMDVDQFVLSTIIPGVISAEDYETPVTELVYNISRNLGPNEGFLVNLDDHTTPISSFKQDDLENHRIGYQPPNMSYSERRIYEIGFTVFDSHFAYSMPIVLHIAVRSSATNAPRVSYNTGIVLLEGQSRPITTSNLRIVDRDNLHRVKIYIKGGLRYGRLEVNGRKAIYFTANDIQEGHVVYYHDDSDTTRDHIEFRITDGSSNVLANVPITIIPKDDSPPYLVNSLGIELNEGDLKRIGNTVLLAHDTDSFDKNIIYTIVQPPVSGEILRKLRPSDTGTRINKFIQRDVLKGQIYYRHFGHEAFRDSFRFTLKDNQDPPNESEVEIFHIVVNPVNENAPQLAPQASRLMHVLETDIAYITKSELQYTDVETDDNQLTYAITSEPYFVYSSGQEDAGRLISTHNVTMVMKDGSIPPVYTFKQEDINHMKIAYMPPMADIGPEARLVRFVYTVQDSNENKVLGQHFDIDVQPVNNQPPEFVTTKLLVEEGGILGISNNQMSAVDIDTEPSDIVFSFDSMPKHGAIQKDGITLRQGGRFKIRDLKKKAVRYIHDGSEVTQDSFTLTLSDGVNRVSRVISIDIVPIDDQVPRLGENLKPHLIVSEGGEATITSAVLSATDEDTDDGQLVFLIIKQPKYGVMQRDGHPATKFNQQDVASELVKYIHTGGETGSATMRDSVTFIVSDQNYLASVDLPVYDLNITITPVDNQKPTIISGSPVFVDEGGKFTFTPDTVTAKDPDTEPEKIKFMITRQPQRGYLENVKPSEGSEKPNIGVRITSFKLQDIIDNSINYVQANHLGVEPIYDEVEFYATDGNLNSPTETIGITIVPRNDEEPDVMLHDFTIPEGGSMIVDQSMVDAIDLDMPKDAITLSISQQPEHGDIVIMLHTKNGDVEAAVHDFSIDELHSGMQLKYRHDNSEHFHDKFALTVSDGLHEVKKVCNITIEAVNDERPEIIKNAGLELDYGDYAMISSVVLQSMDTDNPHEEITFILVSVPRKGSLQFCSDPFSPGPTYESECFDLLIGMNFTQIDIDMNRIRYIHTTSMGGFETDSFLFVLSDGINKREVETFEIRIRNSRKANLALLNKGLKLVEGERAIITTGNLSASDESTKAEEIVFAVMESPRLGQIEYIDKPLVSISSFTQLDIASHKIVYNHLTKSDITDDFFTFTVTNGLSDIEAKDGEFKISIDPLDRVLPSLVKNTLVEVLEGSEVTITPLNLKVEDPDTAVWNLTYVLAKTPTYGQLYNRGVLITQRFKQSDLDLGFITYESDGAHTGLDNFLFTISDGRHDGYLINGTLQTKPVMCSIFIKPLVNDAPKLLVKNHPDMLHYFGNRRYGYYLNSRNLKSVDSDTENTHLMYVLIQRPKLGHIENQASKRYVRRRFSQKDLDDNSLLYVLDGQEAATNDSFTFRVEDNRGNSLDNQKFELHWSIVQFSRTYLVACENVGTLHVTLQRTGSLDQMAFVEIKVREMSAQVGEDFIPSTAAQVQFEPGMAQATWDVIIREDNLEENNEKFRLTLENPVNTILGDRDKTNVRVINADNGDCPQYLGMVSRRYPESNPEDSFFLPAVVNGESDTIVTYHAIDKVKKANPFENTYNTEPGDQALEQSPAVEATATGERETTQVSKTLKKKKKKGKGKKKKGGKKNGKRKKKGKSRKNKGLKKKKLSKNSDLLVHQENVQAPQRCTTSTKGLLHFDLFEQQLYKCDGQEWQTWRSDGNQDGPAPAPSQDEQPTNTKGCPQAGWSEFEGRCYKFIDEKMTWEDAERLCQTSYQAHLTSIRSNKHHWWISKMGGKKSFWIGLNDRGETGVWTYTNGEPLNVTKWRRGGPRVKRMLHTKNCVLVNKARRWKNKPCDRPQTRFICEQTPNTIKNAPSRQNVRSRYRNSNTRQEGFFFK